MFVKKSHLKKLEYKLDCLDDDLSRIKAMIRRRDDIRNSYETKFDKLMDELGYETYSEPAKEGVRKKRAKK